MRPHAGPEGIDDGGPATIPYREAYLQAAVLDIAMPRSATRRYAAPVTLLLALAFMLTPATAECNYLGADLPAMVPEP
jgi:hypothetical protein